MSFATQTLRSSNEQFDTSGRAFERGLVEEIRRRVGDQVRRRVELVRAGGGIERIAERDLVTHDEDALLRADEERAERAGIAPGGVVERLAAGKGLIARMRALPRAVFVERAALEVADVDVVEERLRDDR